MSETQKRSSTVAKDTDREKSPCIFSLHGVRYQVTDIAAEAVQGHDPERTRAAHCGQSAAASVHRRAAESTMVGDTSELRIGETGRAYLAAVLDLYSRFVVGWP